MQYVYTLHVPFSRPQTKMSKKDEKKKNKKDSQLVLRLDKEQRDAFVQLCNDLDTSAAREIRAFIRDFLKKHADTD